MGMNGRSAPFCLGTAARFSYRVAMNWQSECAAVIPCLDEAATIAKVIQGLLPFLSRVLVIDDGSSDGTMLAAQTAGAQVLRHENNRGKGHALYTGLSQLHSQGLPYALTLDGDGQHSPTHLPSFFACAQTTQADLVIGNRMGQAQAMPWLRRSVNRRMSQILSRRTGRLIPDSQCGFRLFRLEPWASLHLEAGRFEVESAMLVAAADAGWRIEFVPVSVIPATRPSRLHPVADTVRWLRWWWRDRQRVVSHRARRIDIPR